MVIEVAKACLSRHGRKECVRCQKEQNSIALEHSRRKGDGRIKFKKEREKKKKKKKREKKEENIRSRPAKIASVDIDVCVYDRADKHQSPLRSSNCGSWQPQMTSAGTSHVQIGSTTSRVSHCPASNNRVHAHPFPVLHFRVRYVLTL